MKEVLDPGGTLSMVVERTEHSFHSAEHKLVNWAKSQGKGDIRQFRWPLSIAYITPTPPEHSCRLMTHWVRPNQGQGEGTCLPGTSLQAITLYLVPT